MFYFQDAQQSVTSVLFQDDNYVISAGAVDGYVMLFISFKISALLIKFSLFCFDATQTNFCFKLFHYANFVKSSLCNQSGVKGLVL